MNKIYLMVFDRNAYFNYQLLHEFIKNNYNIKDWWHYMQSSYILVSPLSANDLADSIMTGFRNHRFLLVQITPGNYQGWLTEDAWQWIRKYL